MSKERKIHELIEKGDREEKDRVWAKIQERMREETPQALPAPTPKARPWRKWVAIAASSCAAVLIGVFAFVQFFPFGGENENEGRYFTAQSYESIEHEKTLKEYNEENGTNFLFFDWYEETYHLKKYIWKLVENQETICAKEEIVDINTDCMVYLFVTKASDRLESFSTDENTDKESTVQNVQVYWRYTGDKAVANFEYEGYRYYLRVIEPTDEEYILSLAEELIP